MILTKKNRAKIIRKTGKKSYDVERRGEPREDQPHLQRPKTSVERTQKKTRKEKGKVRNTPYAFRRGEASGTGPPEQTQGWPDWVRVSTCRPPPKSEKDKPKEQRREITGSRNKTKGLPKNTSCNQRGKSLSSGLVHSENLRRGDRGRGKWF